MRENASKKIQAEFKNETTLYKKRIATLRLGTKAFFKDFFCFKWVVVDTFGDCGERKEKRRKERTKTKKHTKKDN